MLNDDHQMQIVRRVGKVKALDDAIEQNPLCGGTGIAHTRWATHGEPSETNAHPHRSGKIAVVHNGIIENYEALRETLKTRGYHFHSQTDTEVIAHLVEWELRSASTLLEAVQKAVVQLRGAYGTVVMNEDQPEHLIVARSGSPLVIGLGVGENFLASDPLALLSVTRRFIYLEESDVAAQVLRSYDFDQLFIGADGIDLALGTTTFSELVGLSQVMAQVAREVIVLIESQKIGRKMPNIELEWQQIDKLITDSDLSPTLKTQIEQQGVDVIIAKKQE